jgi:hypothetical protein
MTSHRHDVTPGRMTITHQDDRDPNETRMLSSDDPVNGDGTRSADRGSAPAEGRRTGEEQAAINRENDPPA